MIKWLAIFLSVVCWTSCSDKNEAELRESLEQKIWEFRKTHLIGKMPDYMRQDCIDAHTGRENFDIKYEDMGFRGTGNFNFPLMANWEVYFYKPPTKGEAIKYLQGKLESIHVEQLFLYDSNRDVWIPISYRKWTLRERKIIEAYETDLWSEDNDWHEIFRDKPISKEHWDWLVDKEPSMKIFRDWLEEK